MSRKRVGLMICLLCFCQGTLWAQSGFPLKGRVKNESGKGLEGASVLLWYQGERDTLKAVTDETGAFRYPRVKPRKLAVAASFVGYKPTMISQDLSQSATEHVLPDLILIPGENTLQNITLESSKIQIKEDTIAYLVDSTMYRKNDNVEALLKNMPGVTVDRDGTVTAQGKQVTKVKVNGKDFFGGDVTTATRELNADMVDRVQFIDDYGDQAAFTGIKEGEATKTMNIQLRKDKNKGYFGNVTAGAGTQERYLTSLSLNRFNNEQQISLLGNLNNTNASQFNFGSFGTGLGSMGNMIGGMVRSMGFGQGGGGLAAALGNAGVSDGISRTQSIGLNYRDAWGPKISFYGSYSYSNRATETIRDVYQQNSFQNQTNTNTRFSNQYDVTQNHRLNMNVEMKLDTANYLKLTTGFTYRDNESTIHTDNATFNKNGQLLNDGYSDEYSQTHVPGFNLNLLYNHRFKKRGRTISLNASTGSSNTEGDDDFFNAFSFYGGGFVTDTSNRQFIAQEILNTNYNARVSYTEPLNARQGLEFNYAYGYQQTGNDRITSLVDPATGNKFPVDSLSTSFDNVYITNRFGVNFRTTQKKYNYTVGLAVQPAVISSRSFSGLYDYRQHIVNFFPVVRYAYNFSRSRSLNINYNGNTSQPSFTQLQPVPDYSNPLFVTIGNPDLRPEFSNTFNIRYNNFDFMSGNVFFGNLLFSFTQDKIVSNTSLLGPGGRQETRYLNADGFYTVAGFYNVSKPIQNRKYVFNLGGTITYNNNISYLNSEKNTGRNWLLVQRVAVDYKVKKWLETTTGVNFTYNQTRYTLPSASLQNLNVQSWLFSHTARIFLPKDFIISYDLDKTLNNGYSETVNAEPFIIGAAIEKQFLPKKNLSLKLQGYDLLNQNIAVSRQVSANAITDTRTNRLGRYVMLSVIFRLNKFNANTGSQNMMQMQMGMPGGGGQSGQMRMGPF